MDATREKAVGPPGEALVAVKPGGGAVARVSAADGDLNILE
jgi:hypothetical protein